jgi:uncharacterized C2H2 Zn-finger protein
MSIESGTYVVARDESQNLPEETVKCRCPKKNFANAAELKQHMIEKHNFGDLGPHKNFLCPDCQVTLKLEKMAKHWERVHNKVLNFACPRCTQMFQTCMKVIKHCEKDHGYRAPTPKENLFCCKCCQLTFAKHSELSNHVKSIHGKGIYFVFACSKCPTLAFRKNTELVQHARGIHEYKTKSTMYEDILEINKAQLKVKKHEKGVKEWFKLIEDKLFTCGVCGLDFFRRSELRSHVKQSHEVKGSYVCMSCPLLIFKNNRELTKHVESDHRFKNDGVISVDVLQKNKTKSEIQKQENRAEEWSQDIESKLFTCGVCGLDFFKHSELRHHVKKSHGGKGGYVCSKCPLLAFKQMSKLRNHAKSEHGYKIVQKTKTLANENRLSSTPEWHTNAGNFFSY